MSRIVVKRWEWVLSLLIVMIFVGSLLLRSALSNRAKPQSISTKDSSGDHTVQNFTDLFPEKLAWDFYPNGLTRQHLLATLSENMHTCINKTGCIYNNETWEGIIRITGDLLIDRSPHYAPAPDPTITIEPGTIVFIAARSDDQGWMHGAFGPVEQDLFNPKDPVKNESYVKSRITIALVSGSIIAKGTKDHPIIITSDAENPQSDDWQGIIVCSGRLNMHRVVIEYFRNLAISSSNVRISHSILRNMMECIVIGCGGEDDPERVRELTVEEWASCINPVITNNHIYNTGHFVITIRSGAPTITHNVIRARPDMEFPGFEYGCVGCEFCTTPTIKHNFIEGGSPILYDGYVCEEYYEYLYAAGVQPFSYFGAIVEYNTFYNCSMYGVSACNYNWTMKYNNFVNNKANFRLIEGGPFWAPSGDPFLEKLFENFTFTFLDDICIANNYWGYTDENQIRDSIWICAENLTVTLKPFETSFIQEALPSFQVLFDHTIQFLLKTVGSDGNLVENVGLTLFDQNSTVVWNGVSDNLGRANFTLTFSDTNYTRTLRLEASKGNYSAKTSISFLSDIPIVITMRHFTDLNGDGVINIQDLFTVAKAFGTKEGDPNYNSIADIDNNKEINIVDLYEVAKDYGKTV